MQSARKFRGALAHKSHEKKQNQKDGFRVAGATGIEPLPVSTIGLQATGRDFSGLTTSQSEAHALQACRHGNASSVTALPLCRYFGGPQMPKQLRHVFRLQYLDPGWITTSIHDS
jgi:hypothetical protein